MDIFGGRLILLVRGSLKTDFLEVRSQLRPEGYTLASKARLRGGRVLQTVNCGEVKTVFTLGSAGSSALQRMEWHCGRAGRELWPKRKRRLGLSSGKPLEDFKWMID